MYLILRYLNKQIIQTHPTDRIKTLDRASIVQKFKRRTSIKCKFTDFRATWRYVFNIPLMVYIPPISNKLIGSYLYGADGFFRDQWSECFFLTFKYIINKGYMN